MVCLAVGGRVSKDSKKYYDDADCYTVAEFCERNRMSTSMYYQLKKRGDGPVEFYVGNKPLITKEEAAKWRSLMVDKAQRKQPR